MRRAPGASLPSPALCPPASMPAPSCPAPCRQLARLVMRSQEPYLRFDLEAASKASGCCWNGAGHWQRRALHRLAAGVPPLTRTL